MALRVRINGDILCAALHPPELGDVYIDDGVHYWLSVRARLIVAEPNEQHMKSGLWWIRGAEPEGTEISDFYKNAEIRTHDSEARLIEEGLA